MQGDLEVAQLALAADCIAEVVVNRYQICVGK
jgi:hypothetical protein